MNRQVQVDHKESGMTLVEVMIAAALFGILVLFGGRAAYLLHYQSKAVEVNHTLNNAKAEMLMLTDCNTSVSLRGGRPVRACDFDPKVTCPSSNYMTIMSKRAGGSGARRQLIRTWTAPPTGKNKSTTSTYGSSLDLRARCGCCPECVDGKGVFLEYKKISPPGPAYEYKPMFNGLPIDCVVN